MKKYLITLTPLEPYFFGDENSFHINGDNENYYIKSICVPPATSIIGMLRYVVLEQNGALRSDGRYTPQQRETISSLIGSAGYNPEGDNSFGMIESISPMFVTDSEGRRYIPTPLNHKTTEKTYTPIKLSDSRVTTSHGEIRVPLADEFDAKNTVGLSYTRLDDGAVCDGLFEDVDRVGIQKQKIKEAFFKKTYRKLAADFSFAFVAELGCQISDTVCYMGREKSAFRLSCTECDFDIEQEICSLIKEDMYYAFSDLILKDTPEYSDFAIVKTGSVKLLTSGYRDSDGSLYIKRGEKHFNVIKAGSVFYGEPDMSKIQKEGYGLNRIIKLGGCK